MGKGYHLVGFAAVVGVIVIFVTVQVVRSSSSTPGIAILQPGEKRIEVRQLSPLDPKADDKSIPKSPSEVQDHISGSPSPSDPVEVSRPEEVVVQVAGAVKRPGVYHLRVGARFDDAVKAAGGLAANANPASVNLAAKAPDGAQLYVKNRIEQPTGGVGEEAGGIVLPAQPAGKSGLKASAKSPTTRTASASGGRTAKLTDPSQGKVNLNTATSEELQKVRGIGPAMAAKIITYRTENHGFQSLEDLLQVSGVGSKTYAKLSPFLKIH